jgi:hypothetical protein
MKDADLMTDTRAERARQVNRRSEKENHRGREEYLFGVREGRAQGRAADFN